MENVFHLTRLVLYFYELLMKIKLAKGIQYSVGGRVSSELMSHSQPGGTQTESHSPTSNVVTKDYFSLVAKAILEVAGNGPSVTSQSVIMRSYQPILEALICS